MCFDFHKAGRARQLKDSNYSKFINRKSYKKQHTMKIAHTIQEVRDWHKDCKGSIGFVPTMGCLHAGHGSLIKQSRLDNAYTVVSIFVNPSQFAPTEDLDKYPRTLPADIELLERLGVDVLFAPSANEMYPQGIPLKVEDQKGPFVTVQGVSEMLEGSSRPNFFRGVATVVAKLLNIVAPTVAYFGQKDIQQFIVLDTMVRQLFINTRLRMMPIERDNSGLALSSRNKYLCQDTLQIASNLYKGLERGAQAVRESQSVKDAQDIKDLILQVWEPQLTQGDFEIDYLSIAHLHTLQEVRSIEPSRTNKIVISCAVYVKDKNDPTVKVRLIDNTIV